MAARRKPVCAIRKSALNGWFFIYERPPHLLRPASYQRWCATFEEALEELHHMDRDWGKAVRSGQASW